MNKASIIKDVKEKWRVYLVIYVMAFLYIVCIDGFPNWTYYIPIRLMAIFCAYAFGNSYYVYKKKISKFDKFIEDVKYTFKGLAIILVLGLMLKLLILIGIDVSAFL